LNAVEIEQAITNLAEQPFDAASFPYAFLEAFGNKATTIQRLRVGASDKSDLGSVLQTNNIHILTCFKNDTERPEKLFDLYIKMTAAADKAPAKKDVAKRAAAKKRI
jgi:hypothetical protein